MNLSSAPAWSFKGKSKELASFQPPGPGTYEPKDKTQSRFDSPPNCKIGTSSRDQIPHNDNPGPGTYNDSEIRPHSFAPKMTSSEKSPPHKSPESPGPGTYNISNKTQGPQYSILGRDGPLTKNDVPGPGQYNSTSNSMNKDKSPSYKIGTSIRTDENKPNEYPGPGTYDISHNGKGPKWGFGSELRSPNGKNSLPGPGAYEVPVEHKGGFTMAKKNPQSSPEAMPGPGAYDQTLRSKSPKWSMGKESRTQNNVSTSPGPGAYSAEVVRPHTAAPIIGSSERNFLNDFQATPGPGTYDSQYKTNGPKFTIIGKEDRKLEISPGPGHYSPDLKDRSPSYKIGSATRDDLIKPSINNGPGPGHYDAKGKEAGPKWGFGSDSKDKNVKNQGPGPGAYESQTPRAKKGFSMGSKQKPKTSDVFPGPGSYDTKAKVQSPKWSMGKQKKIDLPNKSLAENPGPGAYSVGNIRPHSSAPKIANPKGNMSTSSRNDEKKLLDSPGPGQYDTKSKDTGPKWVFGSDSRVKSPKAENPGPGSYDTPGALSKKGYSMPGKGKDLSKDVFPGPGCYDLKDRPRSPTWTIGKTSHDDSTNGFKSLSPGPGAYSPKNCLNEGGMIFGSSNRSLYNNPQETPGPGTYTAMTKPISPSYTMSPKTGQMKSAQSPGPGQYDPKKNQGDPKYSVGKDKKGLDYGLGKSSSLTGPGLYNVKQGPQGPHWGFGSASRDQNLKSDAPGPGQYEIPSGISNLPGYAVPKTH